MWIVRLSGPPARRGLDAAMLVAERDLQVKDLLAMALEAKMPRLDDAGVNRADRDLVNLLALDAEEIRDADDGVLARVPAPGVVAGAVRAVKATGLNQGWPSGRTPYCSANSRSKRWTCGQSGVSEAKLVRVQRRLADVQQARGAVGQDDIEVHGRRTSRHGPEEGGDTLPPA